MSYNPNEFIKLTFKDNRDYNNYKYYPGLNIDKKGFHFYRFQDVLRWFRRYFDCNIWRVKIPQGVNVIEYDYYLKSNQIILSDCCYFYDNLELTQMAVSVNPFSLEWVPNVTPQLCLLAIENRDNNKIREYVKKFGLNNI